jgi:hypothetical protein
VNVNNAKPGQIGSSISGLFAGSTVDSLASVEPRLDQGKVGSLPVNPPAKELPVFLILFICQVLDLTEPLAITPTAE